MEDRRAYQRYPIWFPVTVTVGDLEIWGICRDASPKGILVSLVRPIEIDQRVAISFRVSPSGRDRAMRATARRQIANADELYLAFPFRVALEFDETDEELMGELDRHADTQVMT